MAKDIKLNYSNDSMECDINYSPLGDLEREEGLQSAILISLYTDRRAQDDDILPDLNSLDRRGWWGDLTTDITEDEIGSRLWLLERSKTTQAVLNSAKNYIEEALQWLIDDGVAAKIEVTVERQTNDELETLAFEVEIYKNDGNIVIEKFNDLWNAQVV